MKNLGTQIIETERLILRKGRLEDGTVLFENCSSDDKITRYVVWNTHESLDDTMDFLKKWALSYLTDHCYKWMIVLKETNEIIGTMTVVESNIAQKNAEIGYAYGSKFWNNGYGSEALREVLKFLCNEVGFQKIYGKYVKPNQASKRVMEKAGMAHESTLENGSVDKITGERLDLICYSILKEDVCN